MSMVILLWSSMASLCLVLAGIHGGIWLRNRTATHSGAFALVCVGVAAIDLVELSMMHAASTNSYLQLLRLFYLVVLAGFFGLVNFVWIYMQAGRRWLGWAAIGMRVVATVAGLVLPNSLHFSELYALEPTSFLGSPVMVGRGTPNPWLALGVLANLLLTAFFIDAIASVWKQRGARQVIVLGSALLFLVFSGLVNTALIGFGVMRAPLQVTLSFLPIILIMGWRLSKELVRSAQMERELTAAEMRLLASRQRMTLAAEAAKVGFWTLDPATLRLQGTPWAMRLFDMEGEESSHLDRLLGRINPADRDTFRSALADALRSTGLVSVEYRMTGTDGQERWYLSAGSGRHSDSGESLRLTGVTFDISARKHAEAAVSLQRKEAEYLSRVVTVSGLSDMLAQELRQPLDSMLSDAKSAQARLRGVSINRDAIRSLLADIVAMNDRASQVIAKLRDLLRRSDPVREFISLCTLVDDVLGFLGPDLVRRGIQVTPEPERSMRTLAVDRVRIEQVVINLIIQACDALAARPLAERRLRVRVYAIGANAALDVTYRDDAPAAAAASAVDPFLAMKDDNAGIGLAICRLIVDSHGGQIWAEQHPDGAASFRVRLPYQEFTK